MNTPINQVTINANLVENPELHYTKNGNPVTTFRGAYNTRRVILMEIGRLEKMATLFNTCFKIGARVVYYPSRYEDDTIIHRNGKRSYTKTNAFVRENTAVVFLDGIGNCDVRNVISGATCSLDSVNFDKTFNHRW